MVESRDGTFLATHHSQSNLKVVQYYIEDTFNSAILWKTFVWSGFNFVQISSFYLLRLLERVLCLQTRLRFDHTGFMSFVVEIMWTFDSIDPNALCREDVVRFLCAGLLIDLEIGRVRFLYLVTLSASKILYNCVDSAW